MANLKQDLLNDLGNEKYYAELELARLAQEPNVYYKGKVTDMVNILKGLADIDLAQQLVNKYFPDQEQQAAPVQSPAPEQPHPGQSHGE